MALRDIVIHNRDLRALMKDHYALDDLHVIEQFLEAHQTLTIPQMENGLFAASGASGGEADLTGYQNTWVRDTMMIAESHRVTGQPEQSALAVRALLDFYSRHRHRFTDIIEGRTDPSEPMNRPHIRFDGFRLQELPEKWAHAQNDALGYFLRQAAQLAKDGHLELSPSDRELLALFPRYFMAIRYWQDADSGHWEEARKVEASSIGAVLAGLHAYKQWIDIWGAEAYASGGAPADTREVEALIREGESALASLLPWESRGNEDARLDRDADGALIFLTYPSEAIPLAEWPGLLERVADRLAGDYGIKRYRGDSYWCADYRKLLAAETRCADFSDNMDARNALLKPGTEAQWCIFDPAISAAYGRLFAATREKQYLECQFHHFNRSLGQITGGEGPFAPGLCPEMYYLEDSSKGVYVPNDNTPLFWTQANLAVAMEWMRRNLEQV